MAEDVKKLLVQIDASVELLRRNLATGEQQVAIFEKRTQTSLSVIDRQFQKLGTNSGTVFNKMLAGLATLGVAFSLTAIVAATRRGLEFAGSLGETSRQLGVTSRDLQIYRFAASQVGITQEAMDKGLARLTRSLGQAATGGKEQAQVFKALGIDIRDSSGQVKNAGDVIPELADALQKINTPAERAAVLTKLFGKSWSDIVTLLDQGRGQINELRDAANKLGIVLSDEQIQKADQTADRLDALKTALNAKIAGTVSDNADSILELANALATLIDNIGAAMRAWKNFRAQADARLFDRLGNTAAAARARGSVFISDRNESIPGPSVTVKLPPLPAQKPESTDTSGSLDLGDLTGGASAQRSAREAYVAFKSELEKEGFRFSPLQGFRTFDQQAGLFRRLGPGNAAPPGTSDHEFYKAIDLPVKADPVKVAAAAAHAGVTLGDPLTHGGSGNMHRHQPFSDGAGSGGGEEAAERRRKEQLDQEYKIKNEQLQAEQDILRARQAASNDYVEQTTLAIAIADNEKKQYELSLDQRVQMGALTRAQADQFKAAYAQADAFKRQKILADEQTARLKAIAQLEQRDYARKAALLGLQANLATTAAERRRIQQEILAAEIAYKRKLLEGIQNDPNATDADKETARRDQANLDAWGNWRGKELDRSTMNPLEQWKLSVPKTKEEILEAMQDIQARGFDRMADSITQVIMGTKSLGAAFKEIASQIISDIIRMTIRMMIFRTLSSLGAKVGGSFSGSGGAVVDLPGTSAPGVLGAPDLAAFASSLPGFASGGAFQVGDKAGTDNNILSINGRPRARVSADELIAVVPKATVPSASTLGRGRGGNAGPAEVIVHVAASEDFNVKVEKISANTVAIAAPNIVREARDTTVKSLSRRRLG